MAIIRTMVTSGSKDRNKYSVPLCRLAPGSLDKVSRGCMRKVTRMFTMANKTKYDMQCTTWKDKKQVTFIHKNLVQHGGDTTVKRHVKSKNTERIWMHHQFRLTMLIISVDVNDHNSADYSVSIQTSRWYLQVFFWLVDRIVFACFLIVCNMNKDEWLKYKNKHNGRRRFQIYLALSVMEHGITLDWKEPFHKDNKPGWLRRKVNVPYGCRKYYLCKNGMTNGIDHKTSSWKEVKRKRGEKRCNWRNLYW